jgi:hypothetical protein
VKKWGVNEKLDSTIIDHAFRGLKGIWIEVPLYQPKTYNFRANSRRIWDGGSVSLIGNIL